MCASRVSDLRVVSLWYGALRWRWGPRVDAIFDGSCRAHKHVGMRIQAKTQLEMPIVFGRYGQRTLVGAPKHKRITHVLNKWRPRNLPLTFGTAGSPARPSAAARRDLATGQQPAGETKHRNSNMGAC